MDKVKATLSNVFGTVKGKWTSFDKKIKIIIIAVFAVVLISLIVVIALTSATRYGVLYTGASQTETAEIITVLQSELGVSDVKFNANGEILVPENQVESLRAQLSVKGYPKSTFNYDIWDSSVGLFSTDFDKRVKEKQQLQENLRATLCMYDGVESAVVILNIPDTNDYVISNTKEEAGASVVLTLNKALSNESINGIYNLVKTAVKGLKSENITVTDSTGALLKTEDVSEKIEEVDEEELYYTRLNFQNSIVDILENNLSNLFDGVFDDFKVGVDVQLNYDDEFSQKTEYTPSVDEEGNRGGMVDEESYISAGGGTALEGGLVGTTVDSDISPDYPTFEIGEGDEFYYETQKNIHYLVNEEIKQIEKNGYSYDNISASVVVDASDLTQAEIENWQRLIATAIGTTSDKVTFIAHNFALDSTTGNPNGGGLGGDSVIINQRQQTLVFIIIALGVILIVLLIIALTSAGSNKRRAKAKAAAAAAAGTGTAPDPTAVSESFDIQSTSETHRSSHDVDVYEFQSLSENDSELSREGMLKKEIRDFSKANPEIVAQLIRTWMKNDE